MRPLVLYLFICGCPPQLYPITAESAVEAPAGGDLLSIGSPRVNDACHATEVAYTPSYFMGRPQWRISISLIGHRGRRSGHNLTQLAEVGQCALLFPTAASSLQSPSAADRIHSSVPLYQTHNKRCVVQVVIRNDIAGW
jgi:hypothetical protein